MAGTAHYNLTRLNSTAFANDSWKYTDADRVLIDQLLYLGAEGHHHTGAPAGQSASPLAPLLTVLSTGGSMPAAARARYIFTWVDGHGIESGPSPEAFIDMPPAVSSPAKGTDLTTTSTGGHLAPGPYFYALSAYKDAGTFETTAPNGFFELVPLGTATNKITFTLPTLPGGADGLNLYRRGPSNADYRFLSSIAAPDPGDVFVDDGTLTEDPDRGLPAFNTTKGTNMVQVALPSALPAGYQWRIYRTFTAGAYTGSLLTTTNVVTYNDVGALTSVGQPPTGDVSPGSPSKVDLGSEVSGVLPVGMISGIYGHFLEATAADQPDGYAQLNRAGQVRADVLPGSVLVGLARTFR